MTSRGALYIAFGEPARAQARYSIASLRRHSPNLPYVVVSAAPMGDNIPTHVQPEADAGARAYKTTMYALSPFDETLFLDADTELRSSADPGFKLLQYVDLVLAQDTHRVFATNHWPHLLPEEVAYTHETLGTDQLMYFNSGVIFFKRSERVRRLMSAWAIEWQRYGRQDQMALLRAMLANPVRIAALRYPWNTHVANEAVFVYHKHRSARREGAPR